MKLIISSVAAIYLSQYVKADENDTADQTVAELAASEEPDEKKFQSIIDMTFHKLENHPDFLPILKESDSWSKRKAFQKMMSNYGCHCFPTHKSTIGGKGVPVDELDEACRSLYRCHKCINIEDPGSCDTDEGGYKYGLEAAGNINCDVSPSSKRDCQFNQCKCDAHFAQTVFELWTNGAWSYNANYWTNGRYIKNAERDGLAVFDPAISCVMGMNVTPDACCGSDYPNKVPYNQGQRDCCVSAVATYNPVTHQCCEKEGEVKSSSRDCDL